ncbi:MAG: prolyl oligopeptidase family serine peptidase [Bacteriovoracaceae bacterium]
MDNFLWLEDVEGEKALNWVENKNKETENWKHQSGSFKTLKKEFESILQNDDRIPLPYLQNDHAYDFWTDKKNKKGLLRRCSFDEYLKSTPKWETILDIDKLSLEENKDWVFQGHLSLEESKNILVFLSDGGTDKGVVREYNLEKKSFLKSKSFTFAENKFSITWVNEDEVLYGGDFGDNFGTTLSGYAKGIKSIKRGDDLKNSPYVYQGQESDVGVWTFDLEDEDTRYSIIQRSKTFYDYEYFLYEGENKLTKFPIPEKSDLKTVYKGLFIFYLQEDWKVLNRVFPKGCLISIPVEDLDSEEILNTIEIIMFPDGHQSVMEVLSSREGIYIHLLHNVTSELYFCSYQDFGWHLSAVNIPKNGSINYIDADPSCDNVLCSFENFITPRTLYKVQGDVATESKTLKPQFNSKGMVIHQLSANSLDGTSVNYFLVGKKEAIEKGDAPVLQYGYGGFQISMTPSYSATLGKGWLEKGGLYALANIRGGSEFGPNWHSTTIGKERHRRVEDFVSVANDMVSRGITKASKIGIRGGSNGGLLMGSMYTKFPNDIGAVICQVPLLDMLRYTSLPPGASWIGEYGDPSLPDIENYLRQNSPYHNMDENKEYPPIFFITSSKDDRVHPGHARKMSALCDHYFKKNLYYENRVGGHAGSTDATQLAEIEAMIYLFLEQHLMDKK